MKEISYAAPGPWKVLSDGRIVSEHPECRSSIAQVFSMNDWAEGNARLIAAAPELLDALKGLLAEYEDQRDQFGNDPLWQKHSDIEAVEAARIAIIEAGGEE